MGPWLRYAIAFSGPAATAGANFLLSLVLLRVMTPDIFGHFSFLLVVSQFSVGIWSALFSAALPVIMSGGAREARERQIATLFAANLLSMAVAIPLFIALSKGAELTLPAGIFFSLFAGFSLLRQFARTHAYAAGRAVRVMLSDLCYCLVVLAGLPLLWTGHYLRPDLCAALLLAMAALLALLTFGRFYLTPQWKSFSGEALRGYGAIWKQHSGWSIVGVITTEATMNSHAYIVTLFAGPAAFAILSASSLLTRPVAVVTAALGEFERAQMANQIAERDGGMLLRSLRRFRLALLAVWLLTLIALAMLFLIAPHLIFPKAYALDTLMAGALMWMLVALVRIMRAPESSMMQGGGQFRLLAYASIYSAFFSIAGVAIMLWRAEPVWSILGVMAGEIVFAAFLLPAARKWRLDTLPPPRKGAAPLAEGRA